MIDVIKKTMLAGVGAAVITKEKAEAAFSDWVQKGKISADEAKTMASKLAEDGKAEFEKTSGEVKQTVRELLDKAGVGQKDRIEALEKRLLALEIEVANIATNQCVPPVTSESAETPHATKHHKASHAKE